MSDPMLEEETTPTHPGSMSRIDGEQEGDLHTDVLVIESGPAGASAALFLAT